MSKTASQNLEDILDNFDNAMLVTRHPANRLDARPMRVAERKSTVEITFVTDIDSGKVKEIENSPDVAVTMQNGSQYVAISAKATLCRDSARIKQLWSKAWDMWFEGGPEDPSVVLIDVSVVTAEYWDFTGSNRLAFIVEAGKALLQGETVETAGLPGHQKVTR